MPTLQVNYKDLCNLIGKEIPLEELSEKLFLMKCEVGSLAGDEVTLEVTSDRPDLLCSEGLARELRGLLNIEVGLANYRMRRGDLTVRVERSIEDVRPYIAGALIRGLRLTDDSVRQIMQLQEKLHLTYCRNRSKVSIGIHDADKVTHQLTYAAVEPGKIRFTPLDEEREMNGYEILESTPKGREYGWIIKGFSAYPLLYDSEGRVLSLPPIINGVVTQVTPQTSNLLLDVTGTDMRLVDFVNNILVTSLAERGGEIESARILYRQGAATTPNLKPSRKQLKLGFINETLGLRLKTRDAAALLRRMRFGVKPTSKDRLTVTVPPYRADIMHEIDLVEDLAIAYGYNRLQPAFPSTATIGLEREVTRLTRKMRDLMVGLGFIEVLNYIMTGRRAAAEWMNLPAERMVEVANPMSLDFAVLRCMLLPGLLSFLGFNKHVPYPHRIFECGDVVLVDEEAATKTVTRRRLGAVVCNYTVSYEDVQAPLYSLLKNAGVEEWRLQKTDHPSFIKGRCAVIKVLDQESGLIGEIHPQLLQNFGIENPAAAFELDIESTLQT
ncbi:MAG: phenylalanine--tRNA ligase subunit beta [Candidatus Bathyarchaeia archaeon]